MNRIYKTTYVRWNTLSGPPIPIQPNIDPGTHCVLEGYETLPEGDLGEAFVTIWTWDCYEIQEEALPNGMQMFTRSAPDLDTDEPPKGGKLLRAEARRDGDNVVLEFGLSVPAENLRRVLPMVEAYRQQIGSAIGGEWTGHLDDFFAHARAAVDGGEA